MLSLSISCVVQEECKSLEEFSGIPVAKLKANDLSITSLGGRGFGNAEACVLGMVLQVRHRTQVAHHMTSTCVSPPVRSPLTVSFCSNTGQFNAGNSDWTSGGHHSLPTLQCEW